MSWQCQLLLAKGQRFINRYKLFDSLIFIELRITCAISHIIWYETTCHLCAKFNFVSVEIVLHHISTEICIVYIYISDMEWIGVYIYIYIYIMDIVYTIELSVFLTTK